MRIIEKLLLGITLGVVTVSTSNAQWARTNFPDGLQSSLLGAEGDIIYAAVSAGGEGGVERSLDGGDTWTNIGGGLPVGFGENNRWFLNGGDPGVYASSDSGKTWIFCYGFENAGYPGAFASYGTNIIVGTQNGVYLLADSNIVRSSEATRLDPSMTAVIKALAWNGSELIAGGYPGIFISLDSGKNWAQSDNGLTESNIYSLAVLGSNILAATDSGIFLSKNNGASWLPSNTGLKDTDRSLLIMTLGVSGPLIFAGSSPRGQGINTELGGIYLSRDSGITWSPIDSGISDRTQYFTVPSVALTEEYLFISTDIGVWRRPLSDFNVNSAVSLTSAVSPSLTVFPNPTTGPLTLTGESGTVTIENSLGESVLRQPTTPQPPPWKGGGVSLDISALPAGMYFVHVTEKDGSAMTQKIVKE